MAGMSQHRFAAGNIGQTLGRGGLAATPVFGGMALSGQLLRGGDLGRGQAPCYPVPRRIRRFMPVRRRQQIPHIGKQIALPYPFASLVVFTKHDQRFDK